jgi:hypothetical protein
MNVFAYLSDFVKSFGVSISLIISRNIECPENAKINELKPLYPSKKFEVTGNAVVVSVLALCDEKSPNMSTIASTIATSDTNVNLVRP